jgi:sporulation protein YlmC with PRC-barrel domain
MAIKKYLSKEQIVGKQVIDSGARTIGTVRDLAFDLVNQEIALTVALNDQQVFTVTSGDVVGVGDVILLNKVVDLATTPPSVKRTTTSPPPAKKATPVTAPEAEAPAKPGLCKVCSFQNDEKAKFCIKCGSKLSS